MRNVRCDLQLAGLDPADRVDPVVGLCLDPDSSQDRTWSLQERSYCAMIVRGTAQLRWTATLDQQG